MNHHETAYRGLGVEAMTADDECMTTPTKDTIAAAHDEVLQTVRRLSVLGDPATAERITALMRAVDAAPAEITSIRSVLEALATDRKLGRLHVAAALGDDPVEWATSYFPTAQTVGGASL